MKSEGTEGRSPGRPAAGPDRRSRPSMVWHFYGTTAACMGLDEETFIEVNSRPSHSWNECLRRLRAEHSVDSRIFLLSESRRWRTLEREALCWDLAPATWGSLHARRPWSRWLGRSEYQSSMAFLGELRRRPPDLFVFYGNLPTPFARWTASILARRHIPYVATLHGTLLDLPPRGSRRSGGESPTLAGRLLRSLRSGELAFVFRHAAAVLPLTRADRDRIVAAGLADPERIHVLPSGISSLYFHRREAEPKDPYPALCFAGRLSEAKGLLDAVRCVEAVRRRFPQARLHVAGQWLADGYEREVRQFIAGKGLEDAVAFHGYLHPEDLGRLFRRCHLMLFPTRHEGLGRVALEGMLCGLPVAAVAGAGGPDELIRDGRNGLLTAREELPDRVVRCLEDPVALQAMAEQAAAGTASEYSFERMYAKVEELYLKLLG